MIDNVITYATEGCPKCSMLKKQMDSKKIPYSACYDTDYMISRGFTHVPVLEVNGTDLQFKEALNWVKEK